MDDFENEFDEQEKQQAEPSKSLSDRKADYDRLKDDYNGIKDKYNNYRNNKSNNSIQDVNKSNSNRINNAASKRTGEDLAKNTSKEASKKAVSETSKEVGKQATKEVGKQATKEAGKQATKEVGKQVGKQVAKEAGKQAAIHGIAAAAAPVTAGASLAVDAALEVALKAGEIAKRKADQLNAKVKENVGVDLKKSTAVIIAALILMPILITFFAMSSVLVTGSEWLANEDSYEELAKIIEKREFRYAEEGKEKKILLKMTDSELKEILKTDYEKNNSDETLRDLCYETYLKEKAKNEYDDYIPTEGATETERYDVKSTIVKTYLYAEINNFNKIIWNKSSLDNSNVLQTSSASTKTYDNLVFPDLNTYNISLNSNEDSKKDAYIDLVYPHLQKWVIPYSLNVATKDNAMAKDVLENMWHPITVNIYGLDRAVKKTIETWNVECTVIEYIYQIKAPPETDPPYEGDWPRDYSIPGSYHELYKSDGSSHDSSSASAYINGAADYQDIGSLQEHVFIVTPKVNDNGVGYKRSTKVSSTPTIVNEWFDLFKYSAKVTKAEDWYTVNSAKYKIKPINKDLDPDSKSINEVLDSSLKLQETTTEIWDEKLENEETKSETYKISSISEEKYETLGRKISRYEWYIDYAKFRNPADTTKPLNEIYPEKTEEVLAATKLKYEAKFDDNFARIPLESGSVKTYSYRELDFGFQQIDKVYLKDENKLNYNPNINILDIGSIPQDGFAWPVDLVESPNSNVANYIYGETNAYGLGNFHTGIDISHGYKLNTDNPDFTIGPNIIAAHDGVAFGVYSGSRTNETSKWNVVKVRSTDGKFVTVYGHLSNVNVSEGQTITRGQLLGNMGTTGNSSGVHLHYEIYVDGVMQDPLKFYITNPTYGSYSDYVNTPVGHYKYTGSKSSGVTNSATLSSFAAFLAKAEGTGEMKGDKYVAYDDKDTDNSEAELIGTLTVGRGVTWIYNMQAFKDAGINSMEKGDLVSKEIVNALEAKIIEGKRNSVNNYLLDNGITELQQHQKDALVSYMYNTGNIRGFAEAWKKNGMTEGLWTDFFSDPITSGGEVMEGLKSRREAEWYLFTEGTYNIEVYGRQLTKY